VVRRPSSVLHEIEADGGCAFRHHVPETALWPKFYEDDEMNRYKLSNRDCPWMEEDVRTAERCRRPCAMV
jgi:hypothetical protein